MEQTVYDSAKGLYLPASALPRVEFEQPARTCTDMEYMLMGIRQTVDDETDTELIRGVVAWHNDLLQLCQSNCDSCGGSCVLHELETTPETSVKIVREGARAELVDKITQAVATLFEINDGVLYVGPTTKSFKEMVELRLQLVAEAHSPRFTKDELPHITDGAYQTAIERSGGDVSPGPNFRIGLHVVGLLVEASVDQRRNLDDIAVRSRHKIVPQELGIVLKRDVDALYDHDDRGWKEFLRLANTPKGSLFNVTDGTNE